jgi:DNA-binding MarR family transcriptional regulator
VGDEIREDKAHRWRQQNVGRLWLNAYKAFQTHLLDGLHAKGFEYIRSVHLTLMREMDVDGTRMTTLADRLRLTKQAVSQFVMESEELGLVERRADPSDGRAKIVCFTRTGRRIIDASQTIIQEFEDEFAVAVGERRANAMRETLSRFVEGLAEKDE